MAMIEKECSKCGEVKPLDGFNKRKDSKDGYQYSCKECRKQYRQDNKEQIKEYKKQYRQDNKEAISEYNKENYQDNREERLERKKQYNQEHKEERNERERNRRANDVAYALRQNVSSQIRHALKRNNSSKSGESVMKYLPYTISELEDHLESKFEPGMTWENRDEWHIDHIYPQSRLPYDSMSHPNFQKAWALSNLQPLWAHENISKGSKLI